MTGVTAGTTISERVYERANELEVEVSAGRAVGSIATIYIDDLVDEGTGENRWSGLFNDTLVTKKTASLL